MSTKFQTPSRRGGGGATLSASVGGSERGGRRAHEKPQTAQKPHFKDALTSNDTYGQYCKPKPPIFDIQPLVSNGTIQLKNSVKLKQENAGPVKVYSSEWYQQVRPCNTIDHEKQIVDPQLIKTLNKQASIERMMRENLESEYKVSLCRQVSPTKSNTRKKPECQRKTRSRQKNLTEQESREQQLKLPAEVIREIDRMVAKRMRKEFPIRQFTPKKDRMMAEAKQQQEQNSLSFSELENLQGNKRYQSGAKKHVDPAMRAQATYEWKQKKRIEKQLKDHLVLQALDNMQNQQMQELMGDQQQKLESAGAYQEWQRQKVTESQMKKQQKQMEEEEKELMKEQKREDDREACRKWISIKYMDKMIKVQKDQNQVRRSSVKEERGARQKALRKQSCREEFYRWTMRKSSHMRINENATNASNRLAESATRRTKASKYYDGAERRNKSKSSATREGNEPNFNRIKVKQAIVSPSSTKIEHLKSKGSGKFSSHNQQFQNQTPNPTRGRKATPNGTDNRETQHSNNTRLQGSNDRDVRIRRSGGSESRKSNQFIMSSDGRQNSKHIVKSGSGQVLQNMQKTSSNTSFQQQQAASMQSNEGSRKSQKYHGIQQNQYSAQQKSSSTMNQDMAHLTQDGSDSQLGYSPSVEPMTQQRDFSQPSGSHVQRMKQQMEQRRQLELEQSEDADELQKTYSDEEVEEEILGDDHEDGDGDYDDEDGDEGLFYDPAEEDVSNSRSGSAGGGSNQSYKREQQLFVQESAGTSTNYTQANKSFGQPKKKINNFF